jgi:hypothetical protein
MTSIDQTELLFRHPFNMIVSGASGSGKTMLVARLLENYQSMIDTHIAHIMYCYGVFDDQIFAFEKRGIEIYHGLPSENEIKERHKPMLIIYDDLMIDAKSEYLDMLFTRGSHHWNMSIIFLTQNIFTKEIRTPRNNAHYIILLRNPAGEMQVRNLGSQLFPRRLTYFMDAYKKATEVRFGYLLIDIHPRSAEIVKLRTYIFPGEHTHLFVPR